MANRQHGEATAQKPLNPSAFKNDPLSATKAFQELIDVVMTTAETTSSSNIACKKACNYCCYFRVDVSADEVLLIEHYVRMNMPKAMQNIIRERVESNANQIASMTYDQHLHTNVQCCFLLDGICSIYAVRPHACRTFHATDVSNCQRSYLEPNNDSIRLTWIPEVRNVTQMHNHNRAITLQRAGLDYGFYEMQTAVHEALSNPRAIKRFRRGKRTLINAIKIT